MSQFTDKDIHLVAVLDRSGSMSGLIEEMRKGFNSLKAEQLKQDGETYLTVAVFDNEYTRLYTGVNARLTPDLSTDQYYARGVTALLDAVGRTITDVKALRNVPKKTIFVIATDGYENASREYTKPRIQELIKQAEGRKKYPWSFIFMGAGVDAFNKEQYGYTSIHRTMSTSHDAAGAQAFYGGVGSTLTMARSAPMAAVNSMDLSGLSNNPNVTVPDAIPDANITVNNNVTLPKPRRARKTASNVTGGSFSNS